MRIAHAPMESGSVLPGQIEESFKSEQQNIEYRITDAEGNNKRNLTSSFDIPSFHPFCLFGSGQKIALG
jgi:hypothetical protein